MYLQNYVFRIVVHFRPFDTRGPDCDLLVQFDRSDVGFVERRQPREHLEGEHTEGVPVDGLVVPRVADDLAVNKSGQISSVTRRHLLRNHVTMGAVGYSTSPLAEYRITRSTLRGALPV